MGCGEARSVIEASSGERRSRVVLVKILLEDAGAENHDRAKGAVYMANVVSASGFGLPDNGEEKLTVEDGDDLDRAGAGMG